MGILLPLRENHDSLKRWEDYGLPNSWLAASFVNLSKHFKYWTVKLPILKVRLICVCRVSDTGQYKPQTPPLEICELISKAHISGTSCIFLLRADAEMLPSSYAWTSQFSPTMLLCSGIVRDSNLLPLESGEGVIPAAWWLHGETKKCVMEQCWSTLCFWNVAYFQKSSGMRGLQNHCASNYRHICFKPTLIYSQNTSPENSK